MDNFEPAGLGHSPQLGRGAEPLVGESGGGPWLWQG